MEHGGQGRRGGMEGQREREWERGISSRRLNDSHVTKPSRTVCVCVWLHWSFLLIQPFTTFSLPYD